ncbi:Uu.00g068490.m01.CDS01 [Anthostomella pinea]|uniref:Uu.00g068490.m01.CDS01 n=1 Tax=Anthostomella pinea TaxID=933095 RepID=A0AAI8YNC8_9PEZI|nr:Uu.00g068490.m01.CDS01 [Anthostomella pinea]
MSDQSGNAAVQAFINCTPEICPYDSSFYGYRIQIVPNAVFLGLFSLSLLGFLAVFLITRRGGAFTVAVSLGLITEILGYVGRILSWQNQWAELGFLMQICCLTIAPAFLAAGIYFCIRKIVAAFGPENSRIPPQFYTRIFIPCDLISLILQAAGGALASIASHTHGSTTLGDNIMIAGLAFQVFTLLVFMILCVDFGINTLRRTRALGAAALDQDAAIVAIRRSRMFKGFLVALALSTICIFWRSVYRVAELSNGWTGPLMKRQDLFIGFEGVMITVAVLVLNVFHPSLCFRDLMGPRKNFRFWAAKRAVGEPKGDVEKSEVRGKSSTGTSVTGPSGKSSAYASDGEGVERT